MSRCILVTGASSGIGLAITKKLIENGIQVIGLSRHNISDKIDSELFRFERCDLNERNICSAIFKRLFKQYPEIDGLICNAGLGFFGNLEELSEEQIFQVMQVNFLSHALLVKTFLPRLKKKDSNIIFMGSRSGVQGGKRGSIYCASKFAMRGFAQSIREECSASKTRITLFNPGMTQTPFFDTLDFEPGSEEDQSIAPEDIANLVYEVLIMRYGTNIDEIQITPQKKVVQFKAKLDEKSLLECEKA